MSDNAFQTTEATTGNSVIPRSSDNVFCACLLEIATVTLEALNDYSSLILHTRKVHPLAVDNFGPHLKGLTRSPIDEAKKFSNIIPICDYVNTPYVEIGILGGKSTKN